MKVKGETTWTQCLGNLYKITGLQGRIVELLCFGVYDLPSYFLSDTYHLSFYLLQMQKCIKGREGITSWNVEHYFKGIKNARHHIEDYIIQAYLTFAKAQSGIALVTTHL